MNKAFLLLLVLCSCAGLGGPHVKVITLPDGRFGLIGECIGSISVCFDAVRDECKGDFRLIRSGSKGNGSYILARCKTDYNYEQMKKKRSKLNPEESAQKCTDLTGEDYIECLKKI